MGREVRENRRSERNGPNAGDKGNVDVALFDPISSREKKIPSSPAGSRAQGSCLFAQALHVPA